MAASLALGSGAAATTLSTVSILSLTGTDVIRCEVTNLSETKTITVTVEMFDQAGGPKESGVLTIGPLRTQTVAAYDTQLAGRFCRITTSAGKNKVRAALVLFDGARDALVHEAH